MRDCKTIEIEGWGMAVIDKCLLRKSKKKKKTAKDRMIPLMNATAVAWVHSAETYEFGTPECMDKRLAGISASDANTIVHKHKDIRGKNPYMSIAALLRKKMRIDKRVDNVFTRHGIRYEQEALDSCAKLLGISYSDTVGHVRGHGEKEGKMVRGCVTIAEVPVYLGATPDSLTTDARLVECKCPGYAFDGGEELKDRYYAQLQMQMACCNLTECIFVRYKPFTAGTSGVIDITVVAFDLPWWRLALVQFDNFYAKMLSLFRMSKSKAWESIEGDRFRGPRAKLLWLDGKSIRSPVDNEGVPPARKKRKKKDIEETSIVSII